MNSSATTPAPSAMTLTLTGRVIEVGNLDGGNVPGFVIDRGGLTYATITGLTEDEARTVAWHYDKPVTISVGAPVAAAPVAAIPTWQERVTDYTLMTDYPDLMKAEIAELRAALQQRQAPAPTGDTQYFTAVFRVPKGWKPGPEIMEHPYWSAGSWSHALDDRDAAIRRAEHAEATPVASAKPIYQVWDALGGWFDDKAKYDTASPADRRIVYPVAQAAPAPADEPVAMLVCPQCGVDRLKEPCPGMADECAMIADAHLIASPSPHPVSIGAGEDHPALLKVMDDILTPAGWAKYRTDQEIALYPEHFRDIFKAGQCAALPSPEGGAAEAKGGA